MKTKAMIFLLILGATAWAMGPKTYTVCHRGNTLHISKHAVYAHVGHGDRIGPCRGDR